VNDPADSARGVGRGGTSTTGWNLLSQIQLTIIAGGGRNMKIVCIFIMFIAFLAVPAMGGEIWGVVRENGIPKPGLTVKIRYNLDGESSESESCITDQYGLYSVFLDRRGQCELKVYDAKDTDIYSRTIASYKAPVRCNVHLLTTPQK
jgi:hypothetical protein